MRTQNEGGSMNTQNGTIGIDIGGGALKIYGASRGIELPAHIASAGRRTHRTRATGLRTLKPPMRVLTGGTGFYIGLGAHDWGRPVENLGDERFAGSPEVQALLYAGLARYMQTQGCKAIDSADLVVGLTQSAFLADIAPNVRSWLIGRHDWATERAGQAMPETVDYALSVDHVNVTSQAAGALFDYFLDDAGAFIPARKAAFKKEIGIVSVGMNTLELLVLRNGATIERFTDSVTAGVRRMLEIHDPSGYYSRGELDTMLRRGQLDYRDALPVWAAEVYGHIERRWGAAFRRFAAIIVVGGGVLLLNHDLTTRLNGKAHVPDEPVLAVARGLYKLGLQRSRKRG